MRGLLLTASVALLAALAATLGAAGRAGALQSGIRGVVERGPIRPVCEETTPCTAPASGVVLIFSRAGRSAVRVTTSKAGLYRVALAPGLYRVRSLRKYPFGGFPPRAIRVLPGRFTTASFVIDTGIRRAGRSAS